MNTRITDSPLYQHLWGTAEARQVLGEEGRLLGWLEVIAALARAQAAVGVIPASAACQIAEHARPDRLDLGYAAEQTRLTSHSMLGLIRALQEVLPEEAREHVYTGATVQDITDTWTALALRRIGGIVWRDLRRIEELLLELAVEHRSTVMAGRTHGQPGSPVTLAGRRPPGPTRSAATWTGFARARPGGWSGSSAAASAAWCSTESSAPRSGPGSAPSSGWPTRASRGSPPVTGAPSSPSSSR